MSHHAAIFDSPHRQVDSITKLVQSIDQSWHLLWLGVAALLIATV
ncbi:hypothetical protein [Streptomyces sp. CB01580]|nr:hypothetical protein [Streptomyces sp. CB01580]